MASFWCDSASLKKVVSIASRFAQARSPDVRFTCLEVSFNSGELMIAGVDSFRSFAIAKLKCDGEGSFVTHVAAALFKNAVNSLRAGEVSVSFDGGAIRLRSNKSNLKVRCHDLGLSAVPVPAGGRILFECPRSDLSDAVAACLLAYSNVGGVETGTSFFMPENGVIVACSSNDSVGRSVTRVAIKDVCPGSYEEPHRLYFDTKLLSAALACCPGETVSVHEEMNCMRVESEVGSISACSGFALSPEGKLPIDRLRNMERQSKVVVSVAEDFFSAIDQACVVKLPEATSGHLFIGNGSLALLSETEVGAFEAEIPCSQPDVVRDVFLNIEDIKICAKCIERDSPVSLAITIAGGEEKGIQVQSESGGFIFISSLIEKA